MELTQRRADRPSSALFLQTAVRYTIFEVEQNSVHKAQNKKKLVKLSVKKTGISFFLLVVEDLVLAAHRTQVCQSLPRYHHRVDNRRKRNGVLKKNGVSVG
jgi:hypothetical protein